MNSVRRRGRVATVHLYSAELRPNCAISKRCQALHSSHYPLICLIASEDRDLFIAPFFNSFLSTSFHYSIVPYYTINPSFSPSPSFHFLSSPLLSSSIPSVIFSYHIFVIFHRIHFSFFLVFTYFYLAFCHRYLLLSNDSFPHVTFHLLICLLVHFAACSFVTPFICPTCTSPVVPLAYHRYELPHRCSRICLL